MVVTGADAAPGAAGELDKLLEFRAEGLVLVSHRLGAAEGGAIAAETPLVVATRRDVTGPGIDTVCTDDQDGAGLAVRHLAALGHRRIAHLGGGDDPVAADRERGYRTAMAAAGLAREVSVVPGGIRAAPPGTRPPGPRWRCGAGPPRCSSPPTSSRRSAHSLPSPRRPASPSPATCRSSATTAPGSAACARSA